MTIEEFKEEVARYEQSLQDKVGNIVKFSGSGPVGMSVIRALIQLLEQQEERLAVLEQE